MPVNKIKLPSLRFSAGNGRLETAWHGAFTNAMPVRGAAVTVMVIFQECDELNRDQHNVVDWFMAYPVLRITRGHGLEVNDTACCRRAPVSTAVSSIKRYTRDTRL